MRILVIDDDAAIRTSLRRCLALDGHEAVPCATGGEALAELRRGAPDAVILDWGLPDLAGVEVCRRMRAAGDATPVLMLTARGEVGDRVEGLDAGADDFMAKPFEVEELLARLRALLRRSTGSVAAGAGAAPDEGIRASSSQLVVADLVLDPGGWTARRGTRELGLTRTEFALLETLMRSAGRTLERSTIMRAVWDYDFDGSTGNLDVYVSYLRRKLEAGGEPRLLHTVRGIGYALRAPSEDADAGS